MNKQSYVVDSGGREASQLGLRAPLATALLLAPSRRAGAAAAPALGAGVPSGAGSLACSGAAAPTPWAARVSHFMSSGASMHITCAKDDGVKQDLTHSLRGAGNRGAPHVAAELWVATIDAQDN